jgi:hypothetical protein
VLDASFVISHMFEELLDYVTKHCGQVPSAPACIWEALGSNINTEASYHDRPFAIFLSISRQILG